MKPAVVSMASTSYGVIAGKAGRDFSAQIGTAVLAAAATVALVISVGFVDEFSSSRLMAALIAMIAAHVLICPRLFFSREVALYGAFVAYSYVTLLWTQNLALAANTLTPIVNFLLVLLMFGSLVAFHDLRAVAAGLLLGFLSGAALYTGIVGFPFSYPADFSYNAIAGMYLFGLFVAILAGWVTRAKVLPLLLAVVF